MSEASILDLLQQALELEVHAFVSYKYQSVVVHDDGFEKLSDHYVKEMEEEFHHINLLLARMANEGYLNASIGIERLILNHQDTQGYLKEDERYEQRAVALYKLITRLLS